MQIRSSQIQAILVLGRGDKDLNPLFGHTYLKKEKVEKIIIK